MNIIQKQTPNFNIGRKGTIPDVIVLHISTGSLASCDDWFSQSISQVSAHYIVGLNGEIHQYVNENDTAWANGQVVIPTAKIIKDRSTINPNLYSVSIEHEGTDLANAPESQLNASVELIRAIAGRYSIPLDRNHIIAHREIKSTKPNCPSSDLSIVDKIVQKCQVVVKSKETILAKLEELKQLIINF